MIKIPFLDLKSQTSAIKSDVMAALVAVVDSTAFAQGPVTAEFESAFAAYCGTKHCVTCSNGTSALHLALGVLDIGPGDEVITTPFTFIATAWAISYCGATPVFVDIDHDRRTLDPSKIEKAITARTRAILPVHLYGMPADMDPINLIASRHGLPVVEDAAQAHGAVYKGRKAGHLGRLGCFSFYPTKNLGAFGEGGAVVTDDDALADRLRRLRNHAQRERYHHEEIGYNYRMESFQGAVLNVKLRHLDRWNAARSAHAKLYGELLRGLPVKLPAEFADSTSVWHAYVVELDNRDRVRDRLSAAGVETGLYYPVPLHQQKPYRPLGYAKGSLPVAERISERCLALPMYPELTDAQVRAVADALRQAITTG
jgi:dTDP-4-amino-4,6-dideoxygalactose transaminase